MRVSTIFYKKLQSQSDSTNPQAVNFPHLYWDIGWFGIAFGSTLSFLPVFATRLGAAGWQIGLFNAIPALVGVLLTMLASRWIEARPLGQVVKQSIVIQRIGFLLFIPLPLVLPPSWQIWAVLLLTLLMAIPGTVLIVAFNAMLATLVSPEFRGHVVGRRNALFAAAIMVSFLVSGQILDRFSFEWGYFVVFGLGAIGAALSTYHVMCLQVPDTPPQFQGRLLQDQAQPGRGPALSGGVPRRLAVGLRLWLKWRPSVASLQRVSSRYWWVMLAYFLFHFSQFLPAPVVPLFWVRELHLTDGQIGWINAIFFMTMLTVSPLLAPLTRRLGNYRLSMGGAILLASPMLLTALSKDMSLLSIANIAGGGTWAILSGALFNRLLELIPDNDRPVHLAIYNVSLNIAILSATMLGPLLADAIGLREILFVIVVLRVGGGLALARWG